MDLYSFIDDPGGVTLTGDLVETLWSDFAGMNADDRADAIAELEIPVYFQESLHLLTQGAINQSLLADVIPEESHDVIKFSAFGPMAANYVFAREVFDAITENDADKFERSVSRFGSSAAIQIVVAHRDDLSAELIKAVLPSAWTAPNLMSPPRAITREAALELFDVTGFLTDGPEAPIEATVLYHGVVFDEGEGEFEGDMWDGMCWTSDIDIARKFASKGAVYTTIAQPQNVLARFDGRNESEYVIDPELHDIELHEILATTPNHLNELRNMLHKQTEEE